MLQYAVYKYLGKGKVIADSAITTTPVDFIITAYCLFSIFYWFMQMIENLLSKMYIEEIL